MKENMEINSILKDFHKISGFRISIHDPEFNEIYSYPQRLTPFCNKIQENPVIKASCIKNDTDAFERVKHTGKVYIYKCRCGLYEAAAPIYHFGILSGYLMMGQIRDDNPDTENCIFSAVKPYFKIKDEAMEYIKTIKPINEDLIYSYIRLMTVIAEYITQSNKLDCYTDNLAPLIKEYINRNYRKKITLNILSQKFGCCNSTLMNCFKKEYKMSINAYINQIKMKNAEKMLLNSNKSLKEIAADCGFYDQNYFSKLFASLHGCPPSEYRKKSV